MSEDRDLAQLREIYPDLRAYQVLRLSAEHIPTQEIVWFDGEQLHRAKAKSQPVPITEVTGVESLGLAAPGNVDEPLSSRRSE